jgi:hypothetical protein
MSEQPLVVLMVEDNEHDMLHVNAYIRKPIGFHSFAETLRIIHLFWDLVELLE